MRAWIPLVVVVLSSLPGCRPSDGYAGGGFGPSLVSNLGVESDGDRIAMDSGSDGQRKENTYMRVRAYTDREAKKVVHDWEGATFYDVEPPELNVVARRTAQGWIYSHKDGASLKVFSDARGKTGQTLAQWVPKRRTRASQVRETTRPVPTTA